MTLLVDFNMMDIEGRILALVAPEQQPLLKVGDLVVVVDEEGNRGQGTVERLSRAATGPQQVAHVALARAANPSAGAPLGPPR
jgi:hypothetical protein